MAAALVGVVGLRNVFFLAFIPSIFAVIAISVAAREASHRLTSPAGRRTFTFSIRELREQGLLRAFVPVGLFELGNVATSLLILRATGLLHTGTRSLTAATTVAILLYAAHNGAATIAALVGGSFIDRYSPRRVFAVGAGVYVAGYLLFAWQQHSVGVLLTGFLLAGAGIGCAETAESTTVAVMLPDGLRGNGFGVLGLVQSVGDLGASLVVGLLWATVGPVIAFAYAAAWMAASVVAVLAQVRHGRTPA
jgi:MFS family permease